MRIRSRGVLAVILGCLLVLIQGCAPILFSDWQKRSPLPKPTPLERHVKTLPPVKDLDVSAEVQAMNERYVVDQRGMRFEVRDRKGKLVYSFPSGISSGSIANWQVSIEGSIVYLAIEKEVAKNHLRTTVWRLDVARNQLRSLPKLSSLIQLASQEVVFGAGRVAVSRGQSPFSRAWDLLIYDLAGDRVIRRLRTLAPPNQEAPLISFHPMAWSSPNELLGHSDQKPQGSSVSSEDVVVFNLKNDSFRWRTNLPPGVLLQGDSVFGHGYLVGSFADTSRPESSSSFILNVGHPRMTLFAGGDEITPLFIDKDGILYFTRAEYSGLWKMRVFGSGSVGRGPRDLTVQGPVRRKWAVNMPHEANGSLDIGPDGTIYAPTGYELLAIRPDGFVKWQAKIGAGNPSVVVATGDAIYVSEQALHAFRLDGTEIWERGGGNEINGLAVGTDGTIYLGDTGGHLHALYPNGTEKWQRYLAHGRQKSVSAPVVGPDGTIYVTSAGGTPHAFTADGRDKWVFDGGRGTPEDPELAADGGILFVLESQEMNGSCTVYMIGSDGKKRWERRVRAEVINDLTVGPDGAIYFTNGDLNVLDASGRPKWVFHARSLLYDAVLGPDGTVYAAGEDGKLYAVSRLGKKLWDFQTSSNVVETGAVGRDGTVYGTASHIVFALVGR